MESVDAGLTKQQQQQPRFIPLTIIALVADASKRN